MRWRCKCDCGVSHDALSTHLVRKLIMSCGCGMTSRGPLHPQWRGHGEISGGVWNHLTRNARGTRGLKRRELEFNITIEYVWGLFLTQNRKCILSGRDLYFPQKCKSKGTASLDRIDSSLGYVPGNVQWVHKDINMLKCTFDQDYFIQMCKEVAEHSRGAG